jgi:hypothetical protein
LVPPVVQSGRGVSQWYGGKSGLVDCVAVAVVVFGAVEVFGVAVPAFAGFFTTCGVGAVIAVVGVVVSVDGTAEVFRAVEPGTGSDEDSAGEPLGTVVAIGSAVVGRDRVVAVRAFWRDADAYCDLGLGLGRGCYEETQTSNSRCCKDFETTHWVSPLVI